MTKVPLHFVAEEAGAKMSFQIGGGTYQTSTDGKNWTDYKSNTEITLANVGDKVYFKAKTSNETCFDENTFSMSFFSIKLGKIAAKGNIQSLLDETLTRMDVP